LKVERGKLKVECNKVCVTLNLSKCDAMQWIASMNFLSSGFDRLNLTVSCWN